MSETSVNLEWLGQGFEFRASSPKDAPAVVIDGNGRIGPSPMAMLLQSVAACAAIDVVDILTKMRMEPRALQVAVSGLRAEGDYPRPWRKIQLEFRLKGDNLTEAAVSRAVSLSMEKYCSVSAMLRHEAEIVHSFRIDG